MRAFCLLALLSSACVNAVLEGPDGATEDVGVTVEPLTVTFINSNGGSALNDTGCKLRYVRGYTMGYSLSSGNNNEYTCPNPSSGDYCQRNGTFPITRKIKATGCFDLNASERRCTLQKTDCNPDGSGCVTTTDGWFKYATSCNPAPHPKASLFCGIGHDADCNNNIYQRRVFDAPVNTLEVF